MGKNGIVEALRTPNIIRPYRDMVDHNYLRSSFVPSGSFWSLFPQSRLSFVHHKIQPCFHVER